MTFQIKECEKYEKELSKMRKSELKSIAQRSHKVADFSISSKWDLIGDILRAQYGVKTLKQCKGWN